MYREQESHDKCHQKSNKVWWQMCSSMLQLLHPRSVEGVTCVIKRGRYCTMPQETRQVTCAALRFRNANFLLVKDRTQTVGQGDFYGLLAINKTSEWKLQVQFVQEVIGRLGGGVTNYFLWWCRKLLPQFHTMVFHMCNIKKLTVPVGLVPILKPSL